MIMNQFLKKHKIKLYYSAYIVILTIICMYLMFPSELLSTFIKRQAERAYPDMNITFNDVGASLSPGIKIKGLKVSLKEKPGVPVYVSEKTTLSISIFDWIRGISRYHFKSRTKGGEISGVIEKIENENKEQIEAVIEIDDVRLDDKVFIHPEITNRLEGMLKGTITFTGETSDFMKGNSEISLAMTSGRIKFKKPVFDVEFAAFKDITLTAVYNNRSLNIKKLEMNGILVNGNTKGTVRVSSNLPLSRLNLKGEVEPLPQLFKEIPAAENAVKLYKKKMKNGNLPIEIKGTIEKPSFRIR